MPKTPKTSIATPTRFQPIAGQLRPIDWQILFLKKTMNFSEFLKKFLEEHGAHSYETKYDAILEKYDFDDKAFPPGEYPKFYVDFGNLDSMKKLDRLKQWEMNSAKSSTDFKYNCVQFITCTGIMGLLDMEGRAHYNHECPGGLTEYESTKLLQACEAEYRHEKIKDDELRSLQLLEGLLSPEIGGIMPGMLGTAFRHTGGVAVLQSYSFDGTNMIFQAMSQTRRQDGSLGPKQPTTLTGAEFRRILLTSTEPETVERFITCWSGMTESDGTEEEYPVEEQSNYNSEDESESEED